MYIVFGYGDYGKRCVELIGAESVAYVVDNDGAKRDLSSCPPICTFGEKREEMRDGEHEVVVAVSEKYEEEILRQLSAAGISTCRRFSELRQKLVKERIERRTDFPAIYRKAVQWVHEHTAQGAGIINNTALQLPYPEVTGYYIPSLLRWGYRDLAIGYAKWLCAIQKEDGSWYDTEDRAPYVFDTAQILKGLLAVKNLFPQADGHIRRGCDWILGNMLPSGRLTTPTKDAWGSPGTCSEIIHIYCLSPLRDAGKIFGEPRYEEAARKILSYYLENHREEIEHFSLLSHFYAYVVEGLIDMGETCIAGKLMERMASFQKADGSVPAYHDVHWVCSTGLFQLAVAWFRLGDMERGNRAFSYACKLQNPSGGWYGSCPHPDHPKEENHYFPAAEISWAVKYFLDALYYRNLALFDEESESFLMDIDPQDGRYRVVHDYCGKCPAGAHELKILDVGCGKGRYLRHLAEEFPQNRYCAVDMSSKVMGYINMKSVEKRQGSLTCIPYEDNFFDIAYTCEALEHAVDIESAVRELARVVRHGGKILIIDKVRDKLGVMEIEEWEQWFDADGLKDTLRAHCSEVVVLKDISYEGNSVPGLFAAWVGIVDKNIGFL